MFGLKLQQSFSEKINSISIQRISGTDQLSNSILWPSAKH
jgi:hypothetical protein